MTIKKFLEFLINENKNNKIMIVFTFVSEKSEKKKPKGNLNKN